MKTETVEPVEPVESVKPVEPEVEVVEPVKVVETYTTKTKDVTPKPKFYGSKTHYEKGSPPFHPSYRKIRKAERIRRKLNRNGNN